MSSLKLDQANVLVVDDQRPFLLLLKGILIHLGARNITLAHNAEEAISACRAKSYDILMVDYNLGQGKNGKQLFEELKLKQLLSASSVFILVTGDNSRAMVLGAVESQPDDYLMKPFSQHVLKSRMLRAYTKKKALEPVFQALLDKDLQRAVELCLQERESGSRYGGYCTQLAAGLLCTMSEFERANTLVDEVLSAKSVTWAELLKAKVLHGMKQFEAAEEQAKKVLGQNNLLVEAHDVVASCLAHRKEYEEALDSIKRAIDVSPYSVDRQHKLVEIARLNEDYQSIIQANLAILEITRCSVYRNPRHLMNAIRAYFLALEHAQPESEFKRIKQELTQALQRGRRDECLSKDFPYEAFEALCLARLDLMQGRALQAKKQTYQAIAILRASTVNTALLAFPDAIVNMYFLAESDEAKILEKQIEEYVKHDEFVANMLASAREKAKTLQANCAEHNKNGLQKYRQQDFAGAIVDFKQALRIAPAHTSTALNMVQACIQELVSQGSKRDHDLYLKAKDTFKILDGFPLAEDHKKKYRDLRQELSQLAKA